MEISAEDIILITVSVSVVIAILVAFFFIIIARYFRVARQKQKEVFEAAISAQESERKRIAEDLHDEIGPMLSAVKLNVGMLNSNRDPAFIQTTIKEAQQALDTSIQDVRRITRNLVPRHIAEQGIAGALGDYINYLKKAQTLDISFAHNLDSHFFGEMVETNLYRVVQELINNALRHGAATVISVDMHLTDKTLILTVKDNGKGFSLQEKHMGMGLKNIQSRVELYKGAHNWETQPGKGATFNAKFNIDNFK